MKYVKDLKELGKNSLSIAGGKAANLGELLNNNIKVPEGFCVTTNAYNKFVIDNKIDQKIKGLIDNIKNTEIVELEEVSNKIRLLFDKDLLIDEIKNEILSEFNNLKIKFGTTFVAVRSSATLEDLPDLSFAGQQDTYLNIDENNILDSVVKCWSSLWSARAIGYRIRNNINTNDVSLAVVVQRMVNSEVSGVMFTANPLTGNRNEIVIDSIYGLGEALVSGKVEPDNFIVNLDERKIVKKEKGSKELIIKSDNVSGVVEENNTNNDFSLSDENVFKLCRSGKQIYNIYENPQDIEWAISNGEIYILQSRPITSLFPIPKKSPNYEDQLWVSFASIQGVIEPFSTFGRQIFKCVAASIANHFGIKADYNSQIIFNDAGERLYINYTPIMKSKIRKKIVPVFTEMVDPALKDTFDVLFKDDKWKITKDKISFKVRIRIFKTISYVAFNAIRNLLSPKKRRIAFEKNVDKILFNAKKEIESAKSAVDKVEKIDNILNNISNDFLKLVTTVVSGQIAFQSVTRLLKEDNDIYFLALELSRSLPHNVTTIMDLELWNKACKIMSDDESYNLINNLGVDEIVELYRIRKLPKVAQESIEEFLVLYGARGIGEIDIGRKRWNEDQTHIIKVLKGYIKNEKLENSPETVFKKGEIVAKEAAKEIQIKMKQKKYSFFKRRYINYMMPRIRELTGLRESPKFMIIRLFWIIKKEMYKIADELVSHGRMKDKNDIFNLELSEIKKILLGDISKENGLNLIEDRKLRYEREYSRKQIPRMIFDNGVVIYDGTELSDEIIVNKNFLKGSPVSHGKYEGVARIIMDPLVEHLLPGEILVCRGTDPAWTPLFLTAGALVMEIGGMMTHGSVVAREYGIPAVVGVSKATTAIKTGQRIKVDGMKGIIELLD